MFNFLSSLLLLQALVFGYSVPAQSPFDLAPVSATGVSPKQIYPQFKPMETLQFPSPKELPYSDSTKVFDLYIKNLARSQLQFAKPLDFSLAYSAIKSHPLEDIPDYIEDPDTEELEDADVPSTTPRKRFNFPVIFRLGMTILESLLKLIPDSNPIKQPISQIIGAVNAVDQIGLGKLIDGIQQTGQDVYATVKDRPIASVDTVVNAIGAVALSQLPASPFRNVLCGAVVCVKVAAAIQRSKGTEGLAKDIKDSLSLALKMIQGPDKNGLVAME